MLQFELRITSCPVSENIKKKAVLPCRTGRTYFGKRFVVNGEQSAVLELILWFSTCKIARATQTDVNL
jgi:hypothetical protein